EMLLDPLEEEFDLPSRPVDLGDGPRAEAEEVGEEEVAPSRGRIEVADAAKIEDAVRFSALNPDGLVGRDARERGWLAALENAESRSPLESRDEVGPLEMDLVEPGAVHVAPIEGHDAVRFGDGPAGRHGCARWLREGRTGCGGGGR